ncbi:MAG: DNA primase DnaG [Methanimicrococcus sp.]|nr:DNA primase DnaG [Methanimicrococcus sp.]
MQNEDTTKYIIRTKISADGVIERPDIVGAIFGQTEGLLGNDLDLRELQKTGRVGRIEVMVTTKNGKTRGNIFIPSSLDKVKTSVLAASLETIDRVGPCVATIEVTKIEDVRASKRVNIVERAKDIYKTMFDDDLMEAQEITDVIRESVRVEDITAYGKNKLPAGPEHNSDEIIVVEGRADILTLLKYGIKNTISVGGTSVPPEVVELLKGKKVTVFTDGDRGGELIIRELMQVSNVDYIARPPDGKAVEDLVQKEIILALRRKMTKDQYIEKCGIILPASKRPKKAIDFEKVSAANKLLEKKTPKRVTKFRQAALLSGSAGKSDDEEEEEAPRVRRVRTEKLSERTDKLEKMAEKAEHSEKVVFEKRFTGQIHQKTDKQKTEKPDEKSDERLDDMIAVKYVEFDADEPEPEIADKKKQIRYAAPVAEPESVYIKRPVRGESRKTGKDEEAEKESKPSVPAPFDKEMKNLTGTLMSRILDENNAVLREIPVRDLANTLKDGVRGAKSVVFDGVITQRIIDIAAEQGIENLTGLKIGNVVKMPAEMKVSAVQN